MRFLASAALCASTLLGACAGEPSEAPARPPAAVPLSELPARHREVLAAYRAGGETWERTREEVRGDALLGPFVIENLVLEMVRAHDALTGPDAARARVALDRAQAELARLAPESVPALVELVVVGDDVVVTLAGHVLAAIAPEEASASTSVSELLGEPESRTRRRAAALLAELAHAGKLEDQVQAELVLALHDPEWFVRAEAARALGARASQSRETGTARGALEGALGDADPSVAASAAEGLGALEDPRTVPALIAALDRASREGHLGLLNAVQVALARASGERARRDVAGWRRWWSDHGEGIEGRSRPRQ
jgi:HEAT repeat protein